MNKIEIQELRILVGLPGSGKTTYANSWCPNPCTVYNNKKHVKIIDCDKYIKSNKKIQIPRFYSDNKIIIVDGLFLTQKAVENIINSIVAETKEYVTINKIIIDYWKENRKACLWNDRGRRDIGSSISIESLPFEEIDAEAIKVKTGIATTIKYHDVHKKDKWEVMIAEHGNPSWDIKENFLKSDRWGLGGESWGYDSDRTYPVSAEDPVEFVALDELLEDIAPTVTYLQYKKIKSACVTYQEENGYDYYSNVNYGFWTCDLRKLYDMLSELGLYELK